MMHLNQLPAQILFSVKKTSLIFEMICIYKQSFPNMLMFVEFMFDAKNMPKHVMVFS